MTTTIPDLGTKIWANIVKPGMVVELSDGTRVEVEQVREGYDTFTFTALNSQTYTVDYATRVKVLSYFNP